MSFLHVMQLFTNPRAAWEAIHEYDYSVIGVVFGHTMLFALIPAVSGYYGTSHVGWQIGVGEVVRITSDSALPIAILYYLAMVFAVLTVGWMIHWMGKTYGADQPLSQCLALATFTVTPLFLVGLAQANPILWVNLLLGLPALAYTSYLFFTGVPVMMEVPPERGFLFSSAVMAFGLVALVAMIVVTVLLWGAGLAPSFTS